MHFFTSLAMYASMPDQYTVDLGNSCIFLMPWWLSCSSVEVLSCSSGSMRTLFLFTGSPSSMDSSPLVPQMCQAILGT